MLKSANSPPWSRRGGCASSRRALPYILLPLRALKTVCGLGPPNASPIGAQPVNKDVMSFLGRKLHPQFQGEIVSDVCDLAFKRIPGARIKHPVKQNRLKMYDKAGSVLRIEMVINEPDGFKV
jgi:hypothetical protein